MAEFREKALRLKKQIIGAMVYPVAVMTIALGILTFILVVIVPRFQKSLRRWKLDLPLTQVLIDISETVANSWLIIIGVFIAVVFGLRMLRNTEVGGNIIDRTLLRVPVLGNVMKKGAVARFTRTLWHVGDLWRRLP